MKHVRKFNEEINDDKLSEIGDDIRNKLSPFANLIALLKRENLNSFILREIDVCEKSLDYLKKLL